MLEFLGVVLAVYFVVAVLVMNAFEKYELTDKDKMNLGDMSKEEAVFFIGRIWPLLFLMLAPLYTLGFFTYWFGRLTKKLGF